MSAPVAEPSSGWADDWLGDWADDWAVEGCDADPANEHYSMVPIVIASDKKLAHPKPLILDELGHWMEGT